MPRNPNKRRCQQSACRNWAMRGYDQCRSHLDPILGPRGAGAPLGNLNALKTGQHINPMSPVQLRRLAAQIAQRPDDLQDLIAAHVHDLYTRVGHGTAGPRAFRTMIAFQETINSLLPHLADALFAAEVEDLVQHCPPQNQAGFRNQLWSVCAPLPPSRRLLAILRHKESLLEELELKKRLAEHSNQSQR